MAGRSRKSNGGAAAYEEEQRREIDEDAGNGPPRKKRKKGGKVKGITARHRMDHHHRRQVGGALPAAGLPGAGLPGAGISGAGLPGAGLPGAGLPGAGLAGAGAGLGGAGIGGAAGVGQLPGLGAGSLPGAGMRTPMMPPMGGALNPAGLAGQGIPPTGTATPIGGGAMPQARVGMRRGGKLPAALEKRKYNGVTPPQKRQVGGGIRVPRPLAGETAAGVRMAPLRGGMGGTGMGGLGTGRGAIAPTSLAPRTPSQPQARALLATGTRPRGYARGGRSAAETEDEHNPCNTGGRTRRQAGGVASDLRQQPQMGTPQRAGALRGHGEVFPTELEGLRTSNPQFRQGLGSSPIQTPYPQRPPNLAPPMQTGGAIVRRPRRSPPGRHGQKWMPGFGDEATGRTDRSRGAPVQEADISPVPARGPAGRLPGYGPDSNAADATGPAVDDRFDNIPMRRGGRTRRQGGGFVPTGGPRGRTQPDVELEPDPHEPGWERHGAGVLPSPLGPGALGGGGYWVPSARPAQKTGGGITASERRALPTKDFGLPGKARTSRGKAESGSYPIDTPGRARAALSYSKRFASSGERAEIKSRVRAKYPGMAVKNGGR